MPEVSQEELDAIGYRSAAEGGRLFCGQNDAAFAINGVRYQWPKRSELTWGLGFSRLGELSDLDCKGAMIEGLKEISDCCGLRFRYVSSANKANVKIITARMDGRGGVLADAQIPVGNVSVDGTQLTLRFDDGDAYVIAENPPQNKIDFYRVSLHEWLHICGLGHKPTNLSERALIEAMYSHIRHLQEADKRELVLRYDGPATPPKPTEPTVPDSTSGVWVFVPGGKSQTTKPA
jgi:hypothetical protein